jgi:Fis family transcriptional regulator
MRLYRRLSVQKFPPYAIQKKKKGDKEVYDNKKAFKHYQKCPDDLLPLIEKLSLEDLVYWKVYSLLEKFDLDPPPSLLKTIITHVERPLYFLVLLKTMGNQTKASEILGCNRNTLRRRIIEFYSIPSYQLRKFFKLDLKSSKEDPSKNTH